MKTIQSLTLVATIALLFLVGKYAATYTGLVGTVRGWLAYYWGKGKGQCV